VAFFVSGTNSQFVIYTRLDSPGHIRFNRPWGNAGGAAGAQNKGQAGACASITQH
jgi:hypothetical protein